MNVSHDSEGACIANAGSSELDSACLFVRRRIPEILPRKLPILPRPGLPCSKGWSLGIIPRDRSGALVYLEP